MPTLLLPQRRAPGARELFVIAILALCALGARAAVADDAEAEPTDARALGGHRFVPSSLVKWGFIENEVTSTSSAGLAKLDLALGDRLAALVGTQEIKAVGVAQSFAGALALSPWLGVSLRLSVNGIIPRNNLSTLAIGAHELYSSEAGVALRLLRTARVQVTAHAGFGWGETRSIVPSLLPASPHVEGDIGTIRPALIAAFSLARWVGLQATASFAWRRLDVVQEDDFRSLRGALAATFALDPAPLTLLIGAELGKDYDRDIETPTSLVVFGSDQTELRTELGLFYQGRRDLDLGAAVSFERDDDGDRRLAHIRMGYYF